MRKYHKLEVKAVVSVVKGKRYWIDGEGDLYSTDTTHPDYLKDSKERSSAKNKKLSKIVNEKAIKKANKKAQMLAKLEEQKRRLLSE